MKEYYVLEDAKWDKKVKKYDIPYLFYGWYPKKWRMDMAYITKAQFEYLKEHGKNVLKFGMKLKVLP